jgi:RNA recognition motif-containing protein
MNIFIAKLNPATTSEDLRALFSEHGVVSSAKVIMDRESGNSKCFGFVEMASDTEGESAVGALNEKEFQGRRIVVKIALPREESRTPNPRRPPGGKNSRQPFNP